ncbi:hypothetical protein D5086_029827 [Populus alba]|uniref:Uncharacterized protein n=1 Tax=Populus alba TaxID=43335 RepID=A0ACC4AUP0_POPAL
MGCEKQDVPRATLTGFRNLAVITMRRLEKMILRKEEELHQKVPNDCVAYDISDTEDSVAELKSFSALQGIIYHTSNGKFSTSSPYDLLPDQDWEEVRRVSVYGSWFGIGKVQNLMLWELGFATKQTSRVVGS